MSSHVAPFPPRRMVWHPDFHLAEALFLVFNLLDAAFTLLYVSGGVAAESNPLLAVAFAVSPVLFVVVKLGLALTALVILHLLRARPAARTAMSAATAAYGAIVLWHLAHLHLGLAVLSLR